MTEDESTMEIPREVKEITPKWRTVEGLFRRVAESETCTMARSGGYRVEQHGGEIVVYHEQTESEVGRWEYAE